MKTQRFAGEQAPLMEAPRNPNEPLFPGTEILGGKYVVVRMLGQGGMGFVVAARHKALGRVDAIKFLLPQLVTHDDITKRFKREAQAVAHLRSLHVARVFDSGITEFGEPYIVMELLEGQDLKGELRRGALPVADMVDYLLQACDAMIEAHEMGIVHRDLKPANLFLANVKNGESCLKVLDFGIAKRIDAEQATDTTIDGGKGFLGTIPYMSPEHLKTPSKVDQRTDIWSLGVVAYELLTNKKPFNGLTKFDLVSKIVDKDEHPEPPSKYCRGLPPAIEMVIGRCLAKEREARWQTVKEFADALRQAAGIPPPPPMRPRMNSVSAESPIELLQIEEAKTQEFTQGKTQAALTMTNPAPSRRSQWAKLGLAGGATLATSATVMGLVMALRDAQTPPKAAQASPGPEVATSSSPMPLVLAEPSAASAAAQAAVREVALPDEVDTGKGEKVGGVAAKTLPPSAPNAAQPVATKTIVPPWEEAPNASATKTSAPVTVTEAPRVADKPKTPSPSTKTTKSPIPVTFK